MKFINYTCAIVRTLIFDNSNNYTILEQETLKRTLKKTNKDAFFQWSPISIYMNASGETRDPEIWIFFQAYCPSFSSLVEYCYQAPPSALKPSTTTGCQSLWVTSHPSLLLIAVIHICPLTGVYSKCLSRCADGGVRQLPHRSWILQCVQHVCRHALPLLLWVDVYTLLSADCIHTLISVINLGTLGKIKVTVDW